MKFFRVPVAIALLLIPVGVMAQRSRPISLGSIAPANSLWDRALKQMATDVQRATDRRVRFRIAANTQGDEAAIVRRLLLGTTQAAALSQIGLEELDESFSVLGMPFFFASDAEARHVLEALRPGFERALAERDLVLINWAHGGWAHLFSSERISSLQEVKNAKLLTTAGDDRMVRWYRENGFDPVPLELSDVPVGLNTGSDQRQSVSSLLCHVASALPCRTLHARPTAWTDHDRDGHDHSELAAAERGGSRCRALCREGGGGPALPGGPTAGHGGGGGDGEARSSGHRA